MFAVLNQINESKDKDTGDNNFIREQIKPLVNEIKTA